MEENNQNSNPLSAEALAKEESPPVSPVIQAPPVLNTEKHKSKLPILIIGIIIFLLLVGSAAGFYIFKQQNLKTAVKPTPAPIVQKQTPTQAPDPTANWKTYTNSKYHFTMDYPTDWKVDFDKVNIANSNWYIVNINADNHNGQAGILRLTIVVTDDKLGTLSKYSARDYIENASFAGIKGFRHSEPDNKSNAAIESFEFGKDGYDYLLTMEWENRRLSYIQNRYGKKPGEIFDHMLSSLKFTGLAPTPSSCTPKPACLDGEPRCMIAEPANGWCP